VQKLALSLTIPLLAAVSVQGQSVSQVLIQSTVSNRTVPTTAADVAGGIFKPNTNGTLQGALFSVYTTKTIANPDFVTAINTVRAYDVANTSALSGALSANIAVALSVIPLSSPSSGVILKKDPVTGAELPVSGTLGPIFTQRAESIGKGKFYLGFTHQNFHFTELNGQSLNGLTVLYQGGDPSAIQNGSKNATTAPATFNVGMDVRLAQDVAFLTYGVTNRLDVSVGLPAVHAAVAARSFNGIVYSGTGTDFNPGNQCWCVNTLTPGTYSLTAPQIGSASGAKTGFGDLLLRVKGTVREKQHSVMALGVDFRFPTGDADNFTGTGTTSVKPFVTLGLYTRPLAHNIILAPHVDVSWQFSGKSVLGGTLAGTQTFATMANGDRVPYLAAPITSTKDTLPDVFSWAVGTELALGKRNTVIFDFLGNQIGLINGALSLKNQALPSGFNPPAGAAAQTSGLVSDGKQSFAQYGGAFGYKVRIAGNLVATFQALVRFNDAGLTARVTPLYGLGYSF
jgi:hypothetical protein